MLKLKIGNNFLLTNWDWNEQKAITDSLAFMSAIFKGENKLVYRIPMSLNMEPIDISEIIKTVEASNKKDLYILSYAFHSPNSFYLAKERKALRNVENNSRKDYIKNLSKELKQRKPDLNIKIIVLDDFVNQKRFKIGQKIIDLLQKDEKSILSILPSLAQYKEAKKRVQNIPNEIKVINNNIENMRKDMATCQYETTLESVKYLNLIDEAKIENTNLCLKLKHLTIYPSRSLGKTYSRDNYVSNPYLYKATKYIYRGYHFGMEPTNITIDTNFALHFDSTVDHKFDNMFLFNNWSGVGYPHFGSNGFCPGEFNDVMAHGREYGMTYYLTALKQYLTTANMLDYAGAKVWWYPIYDDNQKMIYCAGLDIYIEEYLKVKNPTLYEELKDKTWEEKAEALREVCYNHGAISSYGSNATPYRSYDNDNFLQVLKEKEPEEYEIIMKGYDING